MAATQRRKVTQPLGGVTVIISAVLLAFLALVAVTTLRGSNSMFGFGHAFICANEPGTYGSGNWNVSPFGFTARPGAYIASPGSAPPWTTRSRARCDRAES